MNIQASTEPLVTIITPTFNRSHLIIQTVESILNQTYPRIEYIIVDDGSTDNTSQVLAPYANRITLVQQTNQGEAQAVNHGFVRAHGSIVGVVNSDDFIAPNLVECVVERLTAMPELVAIYPDWQAVDLESNPFGPVYRRPYNYKTLLYGVCLPGPGTFFRTKLIEQVGGRNPTYRFVGDWEFWLRIGLHGNMERIPSCLAYFRVHRQSLSSQIDCGAASERTTVIDELFARTDIPEALRPMELQVRAATYTRAAADCLPAKPLESRAYFRRAFTYSPKYMVQHPRTLFSMLVTQLPAQIASSIFAYWRMIKHRSARRSGGKTE